ncbi:MULTISPECIES: DUF2167 domain-containing protein [unclassified Duganella]|uniref:DUF2167 domain-containing protein n=1 Tax=unclassified Duganella TaxID=2636909 RepID=UPI000E34F724|nr:MULTISPECIES: DUF2167 domain-containing protein [unclassified Duganella]RFP09953.1 DUF2167 domain-containing protein [Duganella sp. BJB475]RFP25744.1 DUF2167 domain-containing protein [Duganella sp. BJB476]
MRRVLTALLCLILCAPLLAGAVDAPEQLLAGLHFQTGRVTLPGGIATLELPPHFRYLNPEDSNKLLVDGWGNPPGAPTLGMILPANVDPLGAAGWGVIVSYEPGGHVRDDDAGGIDYAELLVQLKDAVADNNTARREQGYAAMTLIGWAEQPSYDAAQHKLFWAKELHTEGSNENGLNYHVRVLGREGVLVLNAVAGMDQIAQVRSEMKNVAALTDFTPGKRYADFDGKTDKVADYGLAALVAGGVAAKLGLFGKLSALLLAFKQVILVAVAAGGAWLYKVLGRGAAAPAVTPARSGSTPR